MNKLASTMGSCSVFCEFNLYVMFWLQSHSSMPPNSGYTLIIARVLRADSPPTRSRRSIGSGGESSSMLTSVEGNAVQGRMLL
jgi:hypothetical protein